MNPDGTVRMNRSRTRDDSTLHAYKGYIAKKRLVILGLVFAVFAIAVWSIMIGSSDMNLSEVLFDNWTRGAQPPDCGLEPQNSAHSDGNRRGYRLSSRGMRFSEHAEKPLGIR